MKTYNRNQRSTFSVLVLTAVIAFCFSINVNAHSVNRYINHSLALTDTGKMKMKENKMKKKKVAKMNKKMEADKMEADKMGSKM